MESKSNNLFVKKILIIIDHSIFSTIDPLNLSPENKGIVLNLLNGVWKKGDNPINILDPLTGKEFIIVNEIKVIKKSINKFK